MYCVHTFIGVETEMSHKPIPSWSGRLVQNGVCFYTLGPNRAAGKVVCGGLWRMKEREGKGGRGRAPRQLEAQRAIGGEG